MSIGHELHRLSMRVHGDREYFNKPSGNGCNHCLRKITKGPPVPCPTMMYPLSHTSNDVQVFRVHKNYCHKHCLAAAIEDREQNPMLMRNMIVEVYGHDPQLPIRRAFPHWALREYGGSLTSDEFDEWCQTGRCSTIERLLAIDLAPDLLTKWQQFDMSEAERYRRAFTVLKQANRFAMFVFDPLSSFWSTPLKRSDNLYCWNDGHLIEGQVALPAVFEHDEFNRFMCQGLMCSVACQCSYVIRHMKGQHAQQRLSEWNYKFDSHYYFAGRSIQMQRAPNRRLLQLFDGPLTIHEFRSANPRFRLVREAPIQKYPVHVLSEFGSHSISNEKITWDFISDKPKWTDAVQLTSEMHVDELPRLNPITLSDRMEDATLQELKPRNHRVAMNNPHVDPSLGLKPRTTEYLLHMDLLTIEKDEPIVSNKEVLYELVRNAQPKDKLRPRLQLAAAATTSNAEVDMQE